MMINGAVIETWFGRCRKGITLCEMRCDVQEIGHRFLYTNLIKEERW
jgi:hypothetical protein